MLFAMLTPFPCFVFLDACWPAQPQVQTLRAGEKSRKARGRAKWRWVPPWEWGCKIAPCDVCRLIAARKINQYTAERQAAHQHMWTPVEGGAAVRQPVSSPARCDDGESSRGNESGSALQAPGRQRRDCCCRRTVQCANHPSALATLKARAIKSVACRSLETILSWKRCNSHVVQMQAIPLMVRKTCICCESHIARPSRRCGNAAKASESLDNHAGERPASIAQESVRPLLVLKYDEAKKVPGGPIRGSAVKKAGEVLATARI